ncbi:unnamed protein product [Polarella glacialis]|uniref:FHA domain-containing protein n=1 Tax=Polarella glacialis TaxID=89957 RepID=A0A813GR64_POLGL|nr:unnamed protein product [Polarella glacialis]
MATDGHEELPARRLILRSARDHHVLRLDAPTIIGRKDGLDLQVSHASVSSRHASIELLPFSTLTSGSITAEAAEQEELVSAPKVTVALLRDLDSTNGTFADDEQSTGMRVPPEGTRLALGDYVRFGFCPSIYRLEEAPLEGADCTRDAAAGDQESGATPADLRDQRRMQQLKQAEHSYLGWLAQVREEYASVRKQVEMEGAAHAAGDPSLEELEATCLSFSKRPLSRCVSGPQGSRLTSQVSDASIQQEGGLENENHFPAPAEVEAEVERLAGRSWEVASVLRPPLTTAECLRDVGVQLQEALAFVKDGLPNLAKQLGDKVCGPIFQALLARSSRPTPGHAPRERCQDARLDTMDNKKVESLVSEADCLVALLRVKIEDDGDLGLARTVLEDSIRFWRDLEQCAKWRDISCWQLFAEVNDC